MAEQEKQVKEGHAKKTCVNCSKPAKRIAYYYRNGHYFCGKNCFKLYDKKQKEEKLKKQEEEAKKQAEEAAKKAQEEQAKQNPPEPAKEETKEQK